MVEINYKKIGELEHDIKYALAIILKSKRMLHETKCIEYLKSAQEIINEILCEIDDTENTQKGEGKKI